MFIYMYSHIYSFERIGTSHVKYSKKISLHHSDHLHRDPSEKIKTAIGSGKRGGGLVIFCKKAPCAHSGCGCALI